MGITTQFSGKRLASKFCVLMRRVSLQYFVYCKETRRISAQNFRQTPPMQSCGIAPN